MQVDKRTKLSDLHGIITKMSLEVISMAVLPDLGVRWRDMVKAVRNARLPMQPASVARVLCKHVTKALNVEEIEDVVSRLRLKLVATQPRTWHVIRLSEQTTDEPVTATMRAVAGRIAQTLRKTRRSMRPEVQTFLYGDLMYLSVQLISEQKEGAVLYVAVPPGQPVALVSSVTMITLLKATVEGLGYKKYENANLYGRDMKSLLRINDRYWNANPEHLAEIPEYNPIPVITSTGIDYTNKTYDENYVDNLLGPNPPVITELTINTSRTYFDRSQLDKMINLSVTLKSEDVAKTLKCWVTKSALAPTSEFFPIFHQLKSNKIIYSREDSD